MECNAGCYCKKSWSGISQVYVGIPTVVFPSDRGLQWCWTVGSFQTTHTQDIVHSKNKHRITKQAVVFKYTHRLNDKLIQNEIRKKQPLFDYCWRFVFNWSLRRNGLSNRRCRSVSAQDVVDVGELARPLVSVHLRHPVRPETERRTGD